MAKRVRFLASVAFVLALHPTVSLAAGVSVEKATKEQTQAAQRTFQAADDLFDAKRFDEAITAFRASWEIVASPNSRLMIARSLRELGRLDEAYAEFVATIDDAKAGDKYADTKRAAEDELRQLKAKIGLVELKFQGGAPAGKVMVGPKAYDSSSLNKPIVVTPGAITVVATADDGHEVRKEAKVEAGATTAIEIDLTPTAPSEGTPANKPVTAPPAKDEPTPKPSSDLRTYAYIAGGVGAAGLVAFTVFGLMNNSKFNSLESDCNDAGHCSSDKQSDIDAGKRYQTFANIGLVVGVLGVGTGVTLFLLSGDSGEKKSATRPALRIGPRSVAFEGRF
jgi:hypothetical protein